MGHENKTRMLSQRNLRGGYKKNSIKKYPCRLLHCPKPDSCQGMFNSYNKETLR